MPCLLPEIISDIPTGTTSNAKGESAVDKPAYVDYYKFRDPAAPRYATGVQGTVKELASIPTERDSSRLPAPSPTRFCPRVCGRNTKSSRTRSTRSMTTAYSPYERDSSRRKYGVDPSKSATDKSKIPSSSKNGSSSASTWLSPGRRPPGPRGPPKGKMITAAVFPGPRWPRNGPSGLGSLPTRRLLPMLYPSSTRLPGVGERKRWKPLPPWSSPSTADSLSTT